MSKSASENYLDQLLNSVHDSDDHVQEAQKPLDPQEKLERDILGEPESKAQVTAKKEEEFLREFEEELLKTEKETMSDASASKTEVRPSSELSQPIDVEVEKTVDSKPEDK